MISPIKHPLHDEIKSAWQKICGSHIRAPGQCFRPHKANRQRLVVVEPSHTSGLGVVNPWNDQKWLVHGCSCRFRKTIWFTKLYLFMAASQCCTLMTLPRVLWGRSTNQCQHFENHPGWARWTNYTHFFYSLKLGGANDWMPPQLPCSTIVSNTFRVPQWYDSRKYLRLDESSLGCYPDFGSGTEACITQNSLKFYCHSGS